MVLKLIYLLNTPPFTIMRPTSVKDANYSKKARLQVRNTLYRQYLFYISGPIKRRQHRHKYDDLKQKYRIAK
jgi:hypothetical protein